MTDLDMRRKVQELLDTYRKRIASLELAVHGRAEIRRIRVKAYKVPEYEVGAHWRLITRRRQTQAVTSARRKAA